MKKLGFVILLFMIVMTLFIHDRKTPTINEVMTEEPSKLAGYSAEHQEMLYTTRDKEIIQQFLQALEQLEFKKISSKASTPEQEVQLFNKEGKMIADVEFAGNQHVRINEETFRLDTSSSQVLKPFWDRFYHEARTENVTF
ncbi:hypothetical protein GCM10008986_20520 [Salinibacillus aidingensis]|uniref:Uncharacterized protein n=1 Tax=Salinibacillus aidingensis TaxID=237684 RepID=A0ABN1BB20_9BACI